MAVQSEKALSVLFEDQNKVFGQRNKPRNEEPDMFSLMSWQAPESTWDFKKKNVNPKDPEQKKYASRINHTERPFTSESRDNYRPIKRLGDGVLVQEVDPNVLAHVRSQDGVTRAPIQTIEQQEAEVQLRMDPNWKPPIVSQYRDQYVVKDIKTTEELQRQIEENRRQQNKKPISPKKEQSPIDQLDNLPLNKSEDEMTQEEEVEEEKKKKQVHKAKKLDPKNPEDAKKLSRRLDRIKKMKQQSRWLPNTAFTTYYGKPAFGPYGYGNIKPVVGGVMYGHHMLSHNVQPHRSKDIPQYAQSYNGALRQMYQHPNIVPELPRNCIEEQNTGQVEDAMKRNPLTSVPFEEVKKQLSQKKQQQPEIKKPDLVNSYRFASESPTPREKKVQIQVVDSTKVVSKKPKVSKKTKSEKKGKNAQIKEVQEDTLAIPDKAGQKFMDELIRKKEKANRLTMKVGEVNPEEVIKQRASSAVPKVQQSAKISAPSQLDKSEYDPKLYKNVPAEWLEGIPAAGKKKPIGETAKNCFDFGF